MSAPDLLRRTVRALDGAGIPHMVVGSFASSAHGTPRSTQDIDIVIDPTSASLDVFLAALDDGQLYVSPSAQEALERRDQFNVIDPASGWKVDLIIRKDNAFNRSELDRRTRTQLQGLDVWMATPEDTVLAKLEWAALSGSERQVEDAAGILDVQGRTIDDAYLDRWAAELGVTELLDKARRLGR